MPKRKDFETSDWNSRELREEKKETASHPRQVIETRLLGSLLCMYSNPNSSLALVGRLDTTLELFVCAPAPPPPQASRIPHPTDDHHASARSRSLQVAAA